MFLMETLTLTSGWAGQILVRGQRSRWLWPHVCTVLMKAISQECLEEMSEIWHKCPLEVEDDLIRICHRDLWNCRIHAPIMTKFQTNCTDWIDVLYYWIQHVCEECMFQNVGLLCCNIHIWNVVISQKLTYFVDIDLTYIIYYESTQTWILTATSLSLWGIQLPGGKFLWIDHLHAKIWLWFILCWVYHLIAVS